MQFAATGRSGTSKDTLRRYRREKEWFAYKTAALREIAINWCEENGIEWEDRPRTFEAG
jgi:hypothetical protein